MVVVVIALAPLRAVVLGAEIVLDIVTTLRDLARSDARGCWGSP